MSAEYFYGAARKAAPKPSGRPTQPNERRGTPGTGRIVKILVGQGHGYIRLADEREVYFHRADVQDGTAFNSFRVGDTVKFELYEDAVSGARALRVRPQRAR